MILFTLNVNANLFMNLGGIKILLYAEDPSIFLQLSQTVLA